MKRTVITQAAGWLGGGWLAGDGLLNAGTDTVNIITGIASSKDIHDLLFEALKAGLGITVSLLANLAANKMKRSYTRKKAAKAAKQQDAVNDEFN